MKTKEKVQVFFKKLDDKCVQQFGFRIKDLTFNKIVDYMYIPKDSSSLAVTRILFGLAMLFDIPDERGGANMVKRWGDSRTCHFPLFPFLQPMPLPYMALVYAALWLGALGIMLGYKYTVSAPMFTICYWYLFLIEKSFWNNHGYLFGLVALLISCTEANCYWSLDTYLDPSKKKSTVPYWNYFILKYQFFILYFMAGLKKGTAEWLTGYSVQNLSEHWVFDPFKFFLTVPQTDYFVVHWFVFMFDLTVAVWMMCASTRHVAMIFCTLFHLMNSRLFRIGMFPWVCLATMPLFYPFDWPKIVISYTKNYYIQIKSYFLRTINAFNHYYICNHTKASVVDVNQRTENNEDQNESCNENGTESEEEADIDEVENIPKVDEQHQNKDAKCDEEVKDVDTKTDCKRNRTIYLIVCYVLIQAFLPFSHFITKGYNNWTDGMYGYSWDMMVHSWDSSSIAIKVIDNNSKVEMYVDPGHYTLNDRWTRHGDMVYQYVQCLKNNIDMQSTKSKFDNPLQIPYKNISIYVDIWYSMNGRFAQRMFDSKVDILKTSWSPFRKVSYLMPLLDEGLHLRKYLDKYRKRVHSWSDYSDVVFFAEYPGYEQEKFIPMDFTNVTLTILQGTVAYEREVPKNKIGKSYRLTKKQQIKIEPGMLHKVSNIGEQPAFYMYSFYNATIPSEEKNKYLTKSKLPIFMELYKRLYDMMVFGKLVVLNIIQLFKYSRCM